MARDVAGARAGERPAPVRFRRPPRLRIGRPRKLSPEEAAALAARPWPRLPWWLWAAVVVAIAGLLIAAAGLLGQPGTPPPRLGERRTPPGGGLTHDLGDWHAPALAPPGAPDHLARAAAACPRLAGVALAGTPSQVAVLRLATDQVCALRSVGGIDAARTGLREAAALVTFATYQRSANESATLLSPSPEQRRLLGSARVAVLLNPKFTEGAPDVAARRIAVLLVHEGAHLANGTAPPTAEAELAARHAELEACGRLFPEGGADRTKSTRGCADARDLLAHGDAAALRELRASGYR